MVLLVESRKITKITNRGVSDLIPWNILFSITRLQLQDTYNDQLHDTGHTTCVLGKTYERANQ